MNNETARLLWAIKHMVDLDKFMHENSRSDSVRIIALIAACDVLLAGYDFEVKE